MPSSICAMVKNKKVVSIFQNYFKNCNYVCSKSDDKYKLGSNVYNHFKSLCVDVDSYKSVSPSFDFLVQIPMPNSLSKSDVPLKLVPILELSKGGAPL